MIELCSQMLNELEVSSVFSSSSPLVFPKFLTKFKGKNWILDVARDELQTIMQVQGFGNGGTKRYKNPEDKPEGWPSTINFV